MKMQATKRGVLTGGTAEVVTKGYTIAANAKMFKMLSAGIYSNKIRAVVREVVDNAIDECRLNGSTFEVRLPNTMKPVFEVKDYGRGMSEETVMELFSTYGRSTKDDINTADDGSEVIGGFGVGSKAPFSYTDSFTVISRYEGVRTVYIAALGDDDAPTITKVTSENTDEPNGVTVSLAVKQGDTELFADELEFVLRHKDIQPTVTGVSDFELQKETPLLDRTDNEDGVKYSIWNKTLYNPQAEVLIGGNLFKVNRNSFQSVSETSRNTWNNTWKIVRVTIPMGEVEVAVSREELSYTVETVEALTKYFREAVIDAQHQLLEEYNEIDNEFLKACWAEKMYRSVGQHLFPQLQRSFEISDPTDVKDIELGDTRLSSVWSKSHYCSSYDLQPNSSRYSLDPKPIHFLVVDGVKAHAKFHALHIIGDDAKQKVIVVPKSTWDNGFKTEVGNPPKEYYTMSSTLPKPERKGSGSDNEPTLFGLTGTKLKLSQLNPSYRYIVRNYPDKDTVTLDGKEYPISFINNVVVEGDISSRPDIVFVYKSRTSDLELEGVLELDDKGVKSLIDYLKKVGNEYIDKHYKRKISSNLSRARATAKLPKKGKLLTTLHKNLKVLIDPKPDHTGSYHYNRSNGHLVEEIMGTLNIEGSGKYGKQIEALDYVDSVELSEHFPMLKYVGGGEYGHECVQEYVLGIVKSKNI